MTQKSLHIGLAFRFRWMQRRCIMARLEAFRNSRALFHKGDIWWLLLVTRKSTLRNDLIDRAVRRLLVFSLKPGSYNSLNTDAEVIVVLASVSVSEKKVKAAGKVYVSPLSYTQGHGNSVNLACNALLMRKQRIARQVLFQCAQQATVSLFRCVPDLDIYAVVNLAIHRIECKANRPFRLC